MDLQGKPYFAVVRVKSEVADPIPEASNGKAETTTNGSTPLHDADDSGFGECCAVVESHDQPRLGRPLAQHDEFIPEVVHWEPPLRGSSTPYRNEAPSGGFLQLNMDQPGTGVALLAGTEVLEIDLRRKFAGLTELRVTSTGTSRAPICPNLRPLCNETLFQDSRFDHCMKKQRRPCVKEPIPSESQIEQLRHDFMKHETVNVRRAYTGESTPLEAWQNPFPRRSIDRLQSTNNRFSGMTPKYHKRFVDADFYQAPKHVDAPSQLSYDLSCTDRVRAPGAYFNNVSTGRLEEIPLQYSRVKQEPIDVDFNNNSIDDKEQKNILNPSTSSINKLQYQKSSLEYKMDSANQKTTLNETDICTLNQHPSTHFTSTAETVQNDPLGLNNPLIKIENHLNESYRNIYSDVSDEEPEDLTKHRKENPSDCTDTDSTNEPASSPQYCPFTDIALKFESDALPKLREKVSRRKMTMPRRSAEKRDPRFRGVTMWLQTEFKNGQSNLHISAFYSNVKSGCPTTRYHPPCPPVITSPEQYSCSDAEGQSPHHWVKMCASCRTRRTPLWRDAEDGTPLCNACGIRYKKYRLRCSKCWHIPKKEIKTYPNCPVCGASLRYSFHNRKTW